MGPPSPALAALMQNGWPSMDALQNYVAAQKRPAWSVELNFYGPEESVRANWQAAKRRFAKAIPGAAFQDGELLTMPIPKEKEATQADKPRLGIPALEIFMMVARNPAHRRRPCRWPRGLLCLCSPQGLRGLGRCPRNVRNVPRNGRAAHTPSLLHAHQLLLAMFHCGHGGSHLS